MSRKKVFSVIVFAVILTQIVWATSVAVYPAKAASKTVTVPDDFSTIEAAINHAEGGDTILVRKGEYRENPTVDKPLTLRSETPRSAVVIGEGGVARGGKGVFTLSADGIALEGFTIQTLNYTPASNGATGVMLNADNAVISGNSFEGTYYGVFASVTTSTVVTGSYLIDIGKNGIKICGGSQNTISNNFMTGNVQSGAAIDGSSTVISGNVFMNNGLGLGLGASYSVIYGNNFTANTGSGIYFGASNCIVSSNTFEWNLRGIDFSSDFAAPGSNILYHNNFVNNTLQVTSRSSGFSHVWDDGSEGNYWSNYNGLDANGEGIGDSQFAIYGENVDHYPLMFPVAVPQGTQPALPVVPKAITGIVAFWHFNETSQDGVVLDTVGGNTMVLAGDDPPSMLVDGREGKAAFFNGTSYGFANPSTTLNVQNEVTVDAWINVQELKDVEYNNIFVECVRTTDTYPVRVWGVAINGVAPAGSSQPILGALRGFLVDEEGNFNEIDTTQAIPMNQWVHVVFTRSLSEGMKIYMDNNLQDVAVLHGSQNPLGQIATGTECYIGHDAISNIDELSISNIAWQPSASPTPEQTSQPVTQPLYAEWLFWTAIITAFVAFAIAVFLSKRAAAKTPV